MGDAALSPARRRYGPTRRHGRGRHGLAARAELVGRGLDVTEVRHVDERGQWVPGKGGDWNSFVLFSDPDGNAWAVQERPSAR